MIILSFADKLIEEETKQKNMTQANNINGVTAKQITAMMRRTEKLIQYYNSKYNFQMDMATPKEIKEYESALRNWDTMKEKRDLLTFG